MIIKVGSAYADSDLALLARHFRLLDQEIGPLTAAIASSADPESAGLCDVAEYFIGHGFVAAQRYLTSTRAGMGISAVEAFGCGPMVHGNLTMAAALNAGANYWKHMEEWFETLTETKAELKGQALKTLQQLEVVTPWEDYTCSNLLNAILNGQDLALSRLLPMIEVWRDTLYMKFIERAGR